MSDILNIKFNRKTFQIEEITEGEGDSCVHHKPCDEDCSSPIDVAKYKENESIKRISTITVFDGSRICFVSGGRVICVNV